MMLNARKLRAVLALATVSGVFWGIAAVLGRVGYVWYRFGFAFDEIGFLFRYLFLTGFGFGFVGGAIYATSVALLPQRGERPGLSAWQAALSGALGGTLVFLAFRYLGPVSFNGTLSTVIPTAVLAVLGAGFGLGIHGTTKRAALPGDAAESSSLLPKGRTP